jgi:hypothetical protein
MRRGANSRPSARRFLEPSKRCPPEGDGGRDHAGCQPEEGQVTASRREPGVHGEPDERQVEEVDPIARVGEDGHRLRRRPAGRSSRTDGQTDNEDGGCCRDGGVTEVVVQRAGRASEPSPTRPVHEHQKRREGRQRDHRGKASGRPSPAWTGPDMHDGHSTTHPKCKVPEVRRQLRAPNEAVADGRRARGHDMHDECAPRRNRGKTNGDPD